jgi:hypothetical protein
MIGVHVVSEVDWVAVATQKVNPLDQAAQVALDLPLDQAAFVVTLEVDLADLEMAVVSVGDLGVEEDLQRMAVVHPMELRLDLEVLGETLEAAVVVVLAGMMTETAASPLTTGHLVEAVATVSPLLLGKVAAGMVTRIETGTEIETGNETATEKVGMVAMTIGNDSTTAISTKMVDQNEDTETTSLQPLGNGRTSPWILLISGHSVMKWVRHWLVNQRNYSSMLCQSTLSDFDGLREIWRPSSFSCLNQQMASTTQGRCTV